MAVTFSLETCLRIEKMLNGEKDEGMIGKRLAILLALYILFLSEGEIK